MNPRPSPPWSLKLVIGIALLVSVGATVLGVINAESIAREADRREIERVAADLSGCERGNTLRRQVVAIGRANEDLVDGILDVFLGGARDQDAAGDLRDRLAPVFADHRTAIEAIELTDCQSSVAGSTPTTEGS